jgi:NADH-quinone oxidoreductase subunit L
MEKYLYIALFAPLVGSLFAALFGARPKNTVVGIVTSLLLFISWVASMKLLFYVNSRGVVEARLMEWISAGNFHIDFGFVVDQVSAIMMVTVTTVSTVVHIYSNGYMEHDRGFNRFFSYLSAFVFSMMVLVMSDNFLGLFIGWEGVGLCSWLLIGHWYDKPDRPREEYTAISPSWAANEAFVMNRIADLGMLIGLFIIYWNLGTLKYSEVFANVSSLSHITLVLIGIFLFIGAMGKSAQFPLHTWLANAMEGPTPVSALIHAATMVTAGVYLVIRANPIYDLIPEIQILIACIGAFVAIFAASMALVNTDLKRIIAYSTLSQLGYMFVAAGLGAYWVALFHLMAHAFFKALLFLGAGNVMHAMNDELNIKKMGTLNSSMPWTSRMMLVASLALSGVPLFAGFFSKDKILEVAFSFGASEPIGYILWATLLFTAGLTAFYSFRVVFKVFFGKNNYERYGYHPHEAYSFQLWAMAPLAIMAIIFGYYMVPFKEFVNIMLPDFSIEHAHHYFWNLFALTMTMIAIGILVAWYMYRAYDASKDSIEKSGGSLYKLLKEQYYIPVLYEKIFMKPYYAISKFAWEKLDIKVVDMTVDFIANLLYKMGDKSRAMQSGNLSKNLKWMVFGFFVLLVFVVFYKPSI